MVRVKLGGRELRIEDNYLGEYLRRGYSQIDENGNVIKKGEVTTFNQAVVENKKLLAENEALKAENEALKADLAIYKEQVFNMLKPAEGSEAPAAEEAPKAAKKAKK